MNDQPPPRGNSRNKTLAYTIIAFFVLIVLVSGIFYLVYLWPSHEHDTKWYNFSFLPSRDTTMVIAINSTGSQQVTIQNSSSDMATISMYCAPGPGFYQRMDEGNTTVEFRQNFTYECVKIDTVICLPRGYAYQIVLSGKEIFFDNSKIVNRYGTENLTLRVSEW